MSSKRKPRDNFWAGSKTKPRDKVFIDRYVERWDVPYPEASDSVTKVMVTMQDMLLEHSRFMLPGIGIIGISKHPKRGLNLSTTTVWWSPGLANVLAVAPGWQEAPLNSFFTLDQLKHLNWIITRVEAKDKVLLSPHQFYAASDFNMEGITSDEKMEHYAKTFNEASKKNKEQLVEASRRRIMSPKSYGVRISILLDYIETLGGSINLEEEVQKHYDSIQTTNY